MSLRQGHAKTIRNQPGTYLRKDAPDKQEQKIATRTRREARKVAALRSWGGFGARDLTNISEGKNSNHAQKQLGEV